MALRQMVGGTGCPTYNLTSPLDDLTLLDQTVGTEKHNTDLAGLEVHAHALDTRGEPGAMLDRALDELEVRLQDSVNILDKLLSLDVGHAVDTGDTVTSHMQVSRWNSL